MKSTKKIDLSGAKWRFVGNLIQKIISFLLNQQLIQYVSPEILGVATIQLELLLATTLFLSREGIRMAILRNVISTKSDFYKTINLSWIPSIVICIFLTCFSAYHTYHNHSIAPCCSTTIVSSISLLPSSLFSPSLSRITILLYGLGALFESFGEPWLNIYHYNNSFAPRISAEVIAVFIRSVVTFIAVALFDMGVVGFGIAQLLYGITFLIILIYYSCQAPITMKFRSEFSENNNNNDRRGSGDVKTENGKASVISSSLQLVDFLPRFLPVVGATDSSSSSTVSIFQSLTHRFVSTELFFTSLLLTASSLFKHLLTEADRIVLSLFFTAYDQGIFAFANNYGSLIARLIFLPLEESCRLMFSNTVNNIKTEYQILCSALKNDTSSNHNSNSNNNNNNTMMTSAANTTKPTATTDSTLTVQKAVINKHLPQLFSVILILQLLSLFGLFLSLFGPFYVRLLFTLVPFHAKWRSEEVILTLAYYCLYLFVLGFNGVSEAFVHSVCPTNYFYMINLSYAVSTLVYIGFIISAYYFLQNSGNINAMNGLYIYIESVVSSYLSLSVSPFIASITTATSSTPTMSSVEESHITSFSEISASAAVMGASTLVLASAVSMSVRIIFNMVFIHQFFRQPVVYLFPSSASLSSFDTAASAVKVRSGQIDKQQQQQDDDEQLAAYYKHHLKKFVPSFSFLLILVAIFFGLYYSSSQYYHYLLSTSQTYDISMNEITVIKMYKLALMSINTTSQVCNDIDSNNGSCHYNMSSNDNTKSMTSNNKYKVLLSMFYPLIQHLCVGFGLFLVFCITCYLHTPRSMKTEIHKLLRPNNDHS